MTALLTEVDAIHDRLRERRRRQSEAARSSGERLDALRAERAALEQEGAETREKLSRAEIDEAETRMRLEKRSRNCGPISTASPRSLSTHPSPRFPRARRSPAAPASSNASCG